jgi:NADPH:quinone reductase-like Zn-dependent oxidoreductase
MLQATSTQLANESSRNEQRVKVMRAIRIHEYGDASVLRCEDAREPALLPNDVLIRVHAAAVNPADCQFRRGDYRTIAPLAMPAILGWDVSGTVERLGLEVTGFRIGEPVFAMCEMGRDGAYAEFVAVRAMHVAPAPRSLPLKTAAAVPLAALTAWQALFDLGQLTAGQSVLMLGAAGGVGLFAVQLAQLAGARVTATARPENHELLRSLGAERCVDYREANWNSSLRGFDLVLDGVGGTTREEAWDALREGGMLVAIAMPPADTAEAANRRCRGATAQVVPNGARLREIRAMIDAGKLKVLIDSEYPLANVEAAHRRSESRQARGKILLNVASST